MSNDRKMPTGAIYVGLIFTNQSNDGIQFCTHVTNSLSVSAWPYTQNALESARPDFELNEHNIIVVNIDYTQMGVGGDNSWGTLSSKNIS